MKHLLHFEAVTEFPTQPARLRWPWVSFSPSGTAMAYPIDAHALGIRTVARTEVEARYELPRELSLPDENESASETTAFQPGLHAVAVHDDGATLVIFGWHDARAAVFVLSQGRSPVRIDVPWIPGDAAPMAATFSADGRALWCSVESRDRAALCRLAWPLEGEPRLAPFDPAPPPAHHEMVAHPTKDEVLLLMACGQDGTFAQIARANGDGIVRVANEREHGGDPAGSAGWDEAGETLCTVGESGIDAVDGQSLRSLVHIAPPDGLVFRYTGIRFGDHWLASATDEDNESEDLAVVYRSNRLVQTDVTNAPKGMWAGRFGNDFLVTVDGTKGPKRMIRLHRMSWLRVGN